MEPALPPNWKLAKDGDGREYYFNELTGEVSWTIPVVDGEPPANGGGNNGVAQGVAVNAAAVDEAEFAPSNGAGDAPPSVMAPGGFPGGSRERSTSKAARVAEAAAALATTLGEGSLQRFCLILLCSVMLIIQSSIKSYPTQEFDAHHAYGIAVGSISLGVTVFYLAWAKLKPAKFENFMLAKKFDAPQLFSLFLILWWGAAAAVLTFFEPFNMTSNAYFAIWAAVIASFVAVGTAFSNVGDAFTSLAKLELESGKRLLAGLIIAAFIVLFAAINILITPHWSAYSGAGTYALVVGILTDLLGVFLYVMLGKKRASAPLLKGSALLFSVLWMFAVCMLTFAPQPFSVTGNGYFATWAAAGFSLAFAYQQFLGADLPLGSSIRRSFSFKPMTNQVSDAVEARQVDVSTVSADSGHGGAPQAGDVA